MTRLTERVRCIACTHYTTEHAHVEGCSHVACPQRRQVTAAPPTYQPDPDRRGRRDLQRRVVRIFDSFTLPATEL